MKKISIAISLAAVLAEVARKSAYTGAKLEGDDNAFDRISTVDEDTPELRSFFDECRVALSEYFITMLDAEGMGEDDDTYTLTLNVDDGFNQALIPTMQLALKKFFVYGILARWFVYTHVDGAELYMEQSSESLDILWSKTLVRTGERKMHPYP